MPNPEQPKPVMTTEEQENLDKFLAGQKEQEQETEIQEQSEEPLSTPEQAEVLESSKDINKQITKMQEKIGQKIAENQEAVNKRMESAINEAQTGELLPELPGLQTQAEQELGAVQEAIKELGIKTKEELESIELDTSDKSEQAHIAIKQVFDVIRKLQDKETSGQTIAEMTILADRRQYLSQIEENLKALTSPDYIDEELKQAGPGELMQSIAEAGYHIVTQKDGEEIKGYLEQLKHAKEDAAEKMGQANREIDRIQALKKKQREKAESQIPELEQKARQYQAIVMQIEPNLEYQESLLKERDKIEELIKIRAITEAEINEIKQAYKQATEELDKMIPEEIKVQAEKDLQEIQRAIEQMIASSGGSGYKAVLESGIGAVRKLVKYNPEKSSEIKKAFVKAAELGLAAVAIFLVSHIAESGLFGGGEVKAAGSKDVEKMAPYQYKENEMLNLMLKTETLRQSLLFEGGDYLPDSIEAFYKQTYWDIKDTATSQELQTAIKKTQEIDQQMVKESQPSEIQYSGWEMCPQENAEQIVRRIMTTLPEKWRQGSISEIRFTTQKDGMKLGTIIGGEETQPAIIECTPLIFEDKDLVLFSLLTTIVHESLHTTDPFNMNEMPVKLRIEMISKIQERLHAKDRFFDPTFEFYKQLIESKAAQDIKNGNDPKSIESWKECTLIMEYWAYLCTAYILYPEKAEALGPNKNIKPEIPSKDKKLCDWYFKHIAPDFNVQEQAIRRRGSIYIDENKNIKIKTKQDSQIPNSPRIKVILSK